MAAAAVDFSRVKPIRVKINIPDIGVLQDLREDLENERKKVAQLLKQVRQLQKDFKFKTKSNNKQQESARFKKRRAAESSDSEESARSKKRGAAESSDSEESARSKKRKAFESSDSEESEPESFDRNRVSKKAKKEVKERGPTTSQPSLFSLQKKENLRASLKRAIDLSNRAFRLSLLRRLDIIEDAEEANNVTHQIDFDSLSDRFLQIVEEWIFSMYKDSNNGLDQNGRDDIQITVL